MKTAEMIASKVSVGTSGAFAVSLPLNGYAIVQKPQDPSGLDAWAAWAEVRRTGAPLPSWVAEYFDRAAKGILQPLAEYHRPRMRLALRWRVFKALELGRRPGHRGNAYDDMQRREWRRDIGPRVHEKVRGGMSLDAAAVEFAPVSATAVKGAYRWYVEKLLRR